MRMIGRDPDTYHGNRHELDTRLLDLAKEAGCSLLVDRVKKVIWRRGGKHVHWKTERKLSLPFISTQAGGRAWS